METLIQYLILGSCWLLGQATHLAQAADLKYDEFKKRGQPFNFKKDFLIRKQFKIILAFLTGILVLTAYSELVPVFQKVAEFPKTIFILLGYGGSALVLKLLKKGNQRIEEEAMGTGKSNENNQMEDFEYAMDYGEDSSVLITSQELQVSDLTPAQFAQVTMGAIDTSAHEIVWVSQPNFSSAELWVGGIKMGISGPVRRPKPPTH